MCGNNDDMESAAGSSWYARQVVEVAVGLAMDEKQTNVKGRGSITESTVTKNKNTTQAMESCECPLSENRLTNALANVADTHTHIYTLLALL